MTSLGRLLIGGAMIGWFWNAHAAPDYGAKASGSELSSPGIVQDGGPGSSSAAISESNFNADASFVSASTFLPELKAFSRNTTALNDDDITQSTAEAYQVFTSSVAQTIDLNVVLHGIVMDNTTDVSFVLADVFVYGRSDFEVVDGSQCSDGSFRSKFLFDGTYFCGTRLGRSNLFIPDGDVTLPDLLTFDVAAGESFGVYAIVRANSSGGSADATQTLSLGFSDDTFIAPVDPVFTPSPKAAADHLLCYHAEGDKVGVTVDLEDQFGLEAEVKVKQPKLFCNPVAKTTADGEVTEIGDPSSHQTGYKIDSDDKVKRGVVVSNQFGEEQVLSVKKAELLLVPTEKDGVPSERNVDHFKCYKAKGDKVDQAVSLEDQFGLQTGVEVKRPKLFCNPVDKNGEGLVDETSHLTCYNISGGDETDRAAGIFNQFDAQVLELGASDLLCVPSEKLGFEVE